MQIETIACGLQVYDGAGIPAMDGIDGIDGRRYGPFAGVALETQHWPDAVNRPAFPDPILRPGRSYSEETWYRFD